MCESGTFQKLRDVTVRCVVWGKGQRYEAPFSVKKGQKQRYDPEGGVCGCGCACEGVGKQVAILALRNI